MISGNTFSCSDLLKLCVDKPMLPSSIGRSFFPSYTSWLSACRQDRLRFVFCSSWFSGSASSHVVEGRLDLSKSGKEHQCRPTWVLKTLDLQWLLEAVIPLPAQCVRKRIEPNVRQKSLVDFETEYAFDLHFSCLAVISKADLRWSIDEYSQYSERRFEWTIVVA